jgi:hypothetical protein
LSINPEGERWMRRRLTTNLLELLRDVAVGSLMLAMVLTSLRGLIG